MSEVKDTFEARVSRLSNYIIRAFKYNKPSILFALYMSEFLRADVEKSLEKSMKEQGLNVVNVDVGINKDIPSFIASMNSDKTVFLVHNMEKGFPEVLQFINFKREELVDHHARVLFWVKEKELARISAEAPDFFAFRNRVVEFMEVPMAEERRPALIEFALETEYKSLDEIKSSIELKEKLLAELSNEAEISGYLLGSLGVLYSEISSYKKSIEYGEKALEIAKEIGDQRIESAVLGNLGNACRALGDERKAKDYLEQALKMALEIGDKRKESIWLVNLGMVYHDTKEVKKAIEYYKKALNISREIGFDDVESASLGNLGTAYHDLGDINKAFECFEKALKIAQKIGDQTGENIWLGNLGLIYGDLGDMEKSFNFYKKAVKIAQKIGDSNSLGTWLNDIGVNFSRENKYIEALACFLFSKDIRNGMEDPRLKTTESNLKNLREILGKKEFEILEAEVAPRAEEIVKKMLEEI